MTYDYGTGSGLNDTISRLESLKESSTVLEGYSYLGLGTVVVRSHPSPGVDLTYVKRSGESNGDAGDPYIGLDRFGRIVDQRWVVASSGTSTDRFQYGYDRNGNRLFRDNLVNTAFGELYSYDGLNQLVSFDRGTLNGGRTAISGSSSRSQDWDYDALGNFDSVTTNGGSPETRTANAQNEITSISGLTTPTYDANGNMTTDQAGLKYYYDAWNRLVTVKNSAGTMTLTGYQYDGTNRRVSENPGTARDLYYSSSWQVLEERVGGAAQVQYVWSPIYIDAQVLRDRDTDANGTFDERLWVQQDANWNVTSLLGGSGVVERFAYDPFGLATVLSGAYIPISGSGYVWAHLYQGGRVDGTSGLYEFRMRWYSPSLGRWASIDPVRFHAGDGNLYRALSNRPIDLLDPHGLKGKVYVVAFEGAGGKTLGMFNLSPQPLKQVVKGSSIGSLITDVIKAQGVDLDYSWVNALDAFGNGAKAAENAIDAIKKACHGKVAIVGYSWGAITAADVAKTVSTKKDYKFDLVFTIDPVPFGRGLVSAPDVTKNFNALKYAKKWDNFYQRTDTKSLRGNIARGVAVDGANNTEVTATHFLIQGLLDQAFGQLPKGIKPEDYQYYGHTVILRYHPMLIALASDMNDLAVAEKDK